MHTQFLAGVIAAWVVAYVGIGAFFAVAYAIRRQEPEYLLVALSSVALGVYSTGISMGYVTSSWRPAALVASAGAIASTALLLHFSLLFSRTANVTRVMVPAYAISLAYEIINLRDGIFDFESLRLIQVQALGGVVEHALIAVKPPGVVLCGLVGATMWAMPILLLRAYRQGRRDALPAVVGSLVLAATAIHDSLVVLGWIHSIWLAPHGYMAFAFGVACTLLVRYVNLTTEMGEQSTELHRRSNELRRSYQDLHEAQQELVRKEQLAAVGELAAVIAHEVRNPLAIITNAVAGLRRRETAQEDRDTLLAILNEESSRLNRLVSDLLRYARPINVQPQLITMREVIERTMSASARKDGTRAELIEEGTVPPIWGDANLLRQVFENLLDNAQQAMHGAGVVTITLKGDSRNGAEGVTVAVQDTGEGMDNQVRSRAKDPFFTTRPSGTGLGLAIVDRIIERHGGELVIASHAGEGTTITVFLPAGPPHDSLLLFPFSRGSKPPPAGPGMRSGSTT